MILSVSIRTLFRAGRGASGGLGPLLPAVLMLALLPAISMGQPAINVTYVANEGFLVSAGKDKVLIDSLMSRQFLGRYPGAGDDLFGQIQLGRAPFDDIDLVLLTHYHGDHESSQAVLGFLANNQRAQLVAPSQVVELLAKQPGYAGLKGRIRAVTPKPGQTEKLNIGGIEVEVLRLRHSPAYSVDSTGLRKDRYAEVENVGYVVTLAGRKILHVGDSGIGQPEEYAKLGLARQNIAVGFFNSLYREPVAPRSKIVNQYIKPKNIVLMHLRANADPGPITSEQRRVFPKVVIFQKPLESRQF